MTPVDYTNLTRLAPQVYGAMKQEDVCIEEMSELTKAIIKKRRRLDSNIAEEIADVIIMLSQLSHIHNCEEDVQRWIERKCRRLAEEISKEVRNGDYVYVSTNNC